MTLLVIVLFVFLHSSLGQDSDLTENSCEIVYNYTKYNQFYEDVIELVDLTFEGNVQYHFLVGNEEYYIPARGRDCVEQSDVTWCLYIWHPDAIIQACLNSTWSSSNELAARYNIIDNLEYQSTCYDMLTGETGYACLRIKSARAYFHYSFISIRGSCLESSENPYLYSLFYFPSLDGTVYTSAPAKPVHYATYGETIVLTCEFMSRTFVAWSSWRNTTGHEYDFVIEEDFMCNSTVSNCYNDTRTEALKAKTKRVRPYRLSEALDCYGGDKVHLFLVIDDLREEDGGNYTCFGLSSNLQEASNQIQVVPVPPVRQPVTISHSPNVTTWFHGQTNTSFFCSFIAGLGARIHWDTPFGHVLDSAVFENVSMTVVTSGTKMADYFVQYESELTIESNGTAGSICGQYKCIVTDEGNPQDKRDNVLVEYSFLLTKEQYWCKIL